MIPTGRQPTESNQPQSTHEQVPKRWFWHFYAASSVWTALLLWALATHRLPPFLRPSASFSPSAPTVVGLTLLEMQALRRLWESLCLFQYGDARMHLAGTWVGQSVGEWTESKVCRQA